MGLGYLDSIVDYQHVEWDAAGAEIRIFYTSKEEQKMVRAIWNGKVLAESDRTVVVEGNHYFPPEAIKGEFFSESSTHTVCGWKGVASYYDIQVDGKVNPNAAWYYPEPKDAAKKIQGYVAFWHGVEIRENR